jgi:hypothetical protein
MTDMQTAPVTKPDRTLRTAAIAFAGAAAYGSLAALRNNVPGEPLGLNVPTSVAAGLAVGWGAGVAAPWPMPVAALIAATKAGGQEPRVGPGVICAGLGVACIVGTLVEPVTHHLRPSTPTIHAAILMNLGASIFLTTAGLRYLASTRHDTAGKRPTAWLRQHASASEDRPTALA